MNLLREWSSSRIFKRTGSGTHSASISVRLTRSIGIISPVSASMCSGVALTIKADEQIVIRGHGEWHSCAQAARETRHPRETGHH